MTTEKKWWHRNGPVICTNDCQDIEGSYVSLRDWVNDPKGYFLIRVCHDTGYIELGFCRERNKVSFKIKGKKPEDIYYEVGKHELISRWDHMANLGMELEKAYLALKHNLTYIQDEDLSLNKNHE